MNIGLFYDTETTGLPDWKNPSSGEQQPHIVQLGALLVDLDSRKVFSTLDVIVCPDNWDIPKDVVDIHGITRELAMDVGVSECTAVEMFFELWRGSQSRIGYNEAFDARIIRIASMRYLLNTSDIEAWKEGKERAICAGRAAKADMKVTGRAMPKLVEAYRHYKGVELAGAHSAMADARACMDVYFAIQDAAQAA